MLDREEYRSLYSTLHGYINKLISSSVFYDSEDSRDSIGEVVENEISLFYFLASQVGELTQAKELMNKFHDLYSTEDPEEHNHNFSNKKLHELKDEINYIRVCVNNVCKVDLNEVQAFELKEKEDTQKRKAKSEKYTDLPDSLAVYRNAFANHDLSPEQDLGEFLLRSHAHERLSQDIANGSIYIYLTKPKFNVYVKYLLLFLSSIGVFIAAAGIILLLRDFYSANDDSLLKNWATGLVCGSVCSVWFVFSAVQITKSFKNDNFKYSFKEALNGRGAIILLLLVGASIAVQFPTENNGIAGNFVASSIFLAIFMALINICSICFLQPKKNQQLIDDVIAGHMSDISKDASH